VYARGSDVRAVGAKIYSRRANEVIYELVKNGDDMRQIHLGDGESCIGGPVWVMGGSE